MRSNLYTGCRGYDHDSWEGPFYPPGLESARRLEFYAERFQTLLVTDTYDRLPAPEEIRLLRESTPEAFRVSFLAPRIETLEKRLDEVSQVVARFVDAVRPLQGRLGAIVHIVPKDTRLHVSLLDDFLGRIPAGIAHAIEFRASGWFTERTRETLERHDVAVSIHDRAECVAPWWVTADHVVVRRSGPRGKGGERYSSDEVQRVVLRIREDVVPEKTLYLYFENTQEGFACEHARLARELLGA